MKKILFLTIYITCFFLNQFVYGSEIADIENHWAKQNIKESIENNIIDGYEDNTFKPNNSMTVAEFVKIIVKSGNFVLVKEGESLWPDYYIATAKSNGLILENEFEDYNKKINRNEIARLTARYIGIDDIKASKNKFKDLNIEYEKEILKLVNLKVLNGYEDNTYRGENEITRAEAITVASRATKVRRDLINKREYDISSQVKLTNIGKDANVDGIYKDTRYEIKDGNIIIYDNGKYSKLQGYKVNDENINIKKVIKQINIMVDEDSYTGVFYVPVSGILNQLIIMNGENENTINYGNVNFIFTYFEDKPYELRRISKVETFSEKCYMKIELLKLWNNFSEYNNEIYIDEYKKQKLIECLEIEFGIHHAEEMAEYMIDKNIKRVSRESQEEFHAEQKIFGKYIVNYYKDTDDMPQFYIALRD